MLKIIPDAGAADKTIYGAISKPFPLESAVALPEHEHLPD